MIGSLFQPPQPPSLELHLSRPSTGFCLCALFWKYWKYWKYTEDASLFWINWSSPSASWLSFYPIHPNLQTWSDMICNRTLIAVVQIATVSNGRQHYYCAPPPSPRSDFDQVSSLCRTEIRHIEPTCRYDSQYRNATSMFGPWDGNDDAVPSTGEGSKLVSCKLYLVRNMKVVKVCIIRRV